VRPLSKDNNCKQVIAHNSPYISKSDLKAVNDSISTGWLAQGSKVIEFEEALCRYMSDDQNETNLSGVAVSSGTSALFLALKALDIGKGSDVLVPTYACSALLNAVYWTGATPIPVDVSTTHFNPTVDMCSNALTPATEALVLTHTFGVPVDARIYKDLGIKIVEDCCQSIGACYEERKVGLVGDVAVFSFYATKMITTGQGGMVLSHDKSLIDKVRDFRDYDGRDSYYPSFNLQMTDFQAALGISQLARLPSFISLRSDNAKRYVDALGKGAERFLQLGDENTTQNWYRFVLKLGRRMEDCRRIFDQNRISCIQPVQKNELLHRYLELPYVDFPRSEEISGSVLSIPVFPALNENQICRIEQTLSDLVL
jgi:dTDP-4-amino-4,6-dideoxygalactose transaminase